MKPKPFYASTEKRSVKQFHFQCVELCGVQFAFINPQTDLRAKIKVSLILMSFEKAKETKHFFYYAMSSCELRWNFSVDAITMMMNRRRTKISWWIHHFWSANISASIIHLDFSHFNERGEKLNTFQSYLLNRAVSLWRMSFGWEQKQNNFSIQWLCNLVNFHICNWKNLRG